MGSEDLIGLFTGFRQVASLMGGFSAARQARQQADTARSAAAAQAAIQRRQTDLLVGNQIARAAANGVGLGGSVLTTIAGNAGVSELQARLFEWQGQVQANLLEQRGDSALTQGFFGAVEAGLEGLGKINNERIRQTGVGIWPGLRASFEERFGGGGDSSVPARSDGTSLA